MLYEVITDSRARLIFTTRNYLDTLLELKDDLPDLEYLILIEQRQSCSEKHRETLSAISSLVDEWRRLCSELDIPSEKTTPLEKLAHDVCRLIMPTEPQPLQSGSFGQLSPDQFIQQPARQLRLLNFEEFRRSEAPAPHARTAQDVAVVLYTSGTTGRAKGAMLSHANIVSNIQGARHMFKLDGSMHTLSFLPINHVFEQVCGILLPLRNNFV